jgi:hypothetical protein
MLTVILAATFQTLLHDDKRPLRIAGDAERALL